MILFTCLFVEILTLTGERILLIWYRLRNKPLLKSIEWSSLSAELVGKHFSLFTNVELDALTADNTPQFKDIVTSALRRNPQAVLFALYKSLLDTQGCGGAAQHASIAEEIQKESECACFQVSYVGICQWWQCTLDCQYQRQSKSHIHTLSTPLEAPNYYSLL